VTARWRAAVRAVDRWDVRTSAALGRAHTHPTLERGLPLLTRAADKSVLWLGISAVLVATGNARARRAAVRGLGSIGVASLLANQVGKRAVPRRRPDLTPIPDRRVARYVPRSSSFPSGHSASAAAFVLGASLEFPPLAPGLAALGAAVAFSRVYTGVHFPSDVLAGVALGASVAGAGAALVPAHSADADRPAREPRRPQPPRPHGEGVVAVVNPESGGGDGQDVITRLREALPLAEIVELGEDDDVPAVLAAAAGRAEVLAVGGGDGTVCAAAEAAMAHDLPLLVLPAGTFNHFAQDAGLPELSDAIEALRSGDAVRIDVGEADGKPFLNTASLGSYPEFVRRRERLEGRLGKPLAAAVALLWTLRSCPPLQAEIDGAPRCLLMLFVGNGAYQPRGSWPRRRPRLDSGQLDVRYVDVPHRTAAFGLLGAALSGGLLRTARQVEQLRDELLVQLPEGPGYLARDGELGDAPRTVLFRVRRQALTIYRGSMRASG
jgi:undecaprenyl-diphosphatase